MGFNTYPCNPYPISTEELNKGNNDELNARVTALEGEVTDLGSTKTNQITIAPFFNAETAYDPGDLVYYNGLSYRCVNAHEGEWDADDFAATTIAGELDTLKSGLTNVETGHIEAETGVTVIRESLKKSVNVVSLIAVLQKVMTLGSANLLGILPNGFRPIESLVIVAYNDSKGCPIEVEISTSGRVYVYPTPTTADAAEQNIFITVSYIT